MGFLYVKALHIIFVVTWFSGMFYLVRLFVYNREAQDKSKIEKEILTLQFNIMIKRLLFGITWPSAVLTLIFGCSLLIKYASFPIWLMTKLVFVFLLFIYQIILHIIFKNQSNGNFVLSSFQLRILNEFPTIILIAVVFLVVVKQQISLLYGLAGLAAFSAAIISVIRLYKIIRLNKEK